MSETTPKSFWRMPWNGWRGLLLWFVLTAVASFVVIFCLSLINRTNECVADLVAVSLGSAATLAVSVVVAVLFLRWLYRKRRLRHFAFGIACLITLIVLFFTEENWRGRRAWENYRVAAEARGEKFSLTALAPPPVPDERNFALTPLLKATLDFFHTSYGIDWRDTNALTHLQTIRVDLSPEPEDLDSDKSAHLVVGSLEQGTFTDLESCRNFYRGNTNYPQPTTPGTAAADVLVALGKFDPEMNELREAAATRPEARFPLEYDYLPPWTILLPHLSHVRGLTRVVELRAIARLEQGGTGEVFQDLKLGFRLSDSISQEPILIDHLVRIAALSSDLQVVREGLVRHAWNEAQLAELEKQLASLDLLAEFNRAMRGELAMSAEGLDYYRRRGASVNPLTLADDANPANSRRASFIATSLNRLNGGFYYQNTLSIARLHEEFTLVCVDEKTHRVFPETVERMDKEFERLCLRPFLRPYKILAALLMPALANAPIKASRGQTYVDAARVACALERFRLAQGRLPEKLDDLVPRFIDAIPHDVIDGQPLRYRRTDDGGYVLYSIGWNRVDDGGNVVPNRVSPPSTDPKKGDWAWQMPGKR